MRPNISLVEDERLRLRMWKEFRSSSRDHAIPMTGQGRQLQRIVLNRVAGAPGVFEGAQALSLEDRSALSGFYSGKVEEARKAVQRASFGTGQRQVINCGIADLAGAGIVIGENIRSCFIAPADGFIVFCQVNENFVALRTAVRTSGGKSVYIGRGNTNNVGFVPRLEPDWEDGTQPQLQPGFEHIRVPVFSGEEVFVLFDAAAPIAPPVFLATVNFVFEYGAGTIQQAQRFTADFGSVREELTASLGNVRSYQSATRAPSAPRAVSAGGQVTVPAPEIRLSAPEAAGGAGGGAGKTFVSSWMPQAGAIGYLVPDPPAGGRVNVFDGKYTIWSASGQNLGQGPVEPVRSEAEIPPEARVSRNLGVVPSAGLPISVPVGGQLVPAQAVPTPSGRVSLVPKAVGEALGLRAAIARPPGGFFFG